MIRKRAKKPSIAIVGAGTLGSALAVSMRRAGYPIKEVVSRAKPASMRRARLLAKRTGARAVTIGKDPIESEVVWLCVPDREIRGCAEALARSGEWKGKVALHSSGALSSVELRALQKRGAVAASVHPMMTFVADVVPDLEGVPFAVEGDEVALRMARRIIRDLTGQSFTIPENRKAAYHAWGALASPLLISLLVSAERVAGAAGVSRVDARRRILPIVRQTVANYAARGPDRSFSGPVIRGDASTLEKHLGSLSRLPDARDIYLALARSAVRNLPARNRNQLKRVLGNPKGRT